MSSTFVDQNRTDRDAYLESVGFEQANKETLTLYIGSWVTDAMGVAPGDKLSFDFRQRGDVATVHHESLNLEPAASWTLQRASRRTQKHGIVREPVHKLVCAQYDWLPLIRPGQTFRTVFVMPGVFGFILPKNTRYADGRRPIVTHPRYLDLPPFRRAIRQPYDSSTIG